MAAAHRLDFSIDHSVVTHLVCRINHAGKTGVGTLQHRRAMFGVLPAGGALVKRFPAVMSGDIVLACRKDIHGKFFLLEQGGQHATFIAYACQKNERLEADGCDCVGRHGKDHV